MYEYTGGRKMEERPNGDEREQEETPSEQPAEFLSPEEQERVLNEYARPQLEGLRSVLGEKRIALSAAADEAQAEALRSEIAELQQGIIELEEFIYDVTPESEEEAEKRERIIATLREAARRYHENPERGRVVIEFLGDSGDSWFQPDQVAEVSDTEIIFSDGNRFPLRYVEDVELRDEMSEESGGSSDAPLA